MSKLVWSELESNPEVFNKFLRQLGVSKDWEFVDILSFDPEFLEFIPKPVIAVLFLFPIQSKNQIEFNCETEGSETLPAISEGDSKNNFYFLKQTISNACGTVALIHALANNVRHLSFEPDSIFLKFIEETQMMSANERSSYLEQSKDFHEVHEAIAKEGKSFNEPECEHHFITLLHANSKLYQVDGLKDGAASYGDTTEETFLDDAAKICLEFMKKSQSDIRFHAMALVKAL